MFGNDRTDNNNHQRGHILPRKRL